MLNIFKKGSNPSQMDEITVYNKSEVDTALSAKQDKLPTIVNGKYLHTSSTGTIEWTSIDISNKEDKTNKVTSISSSSTDVQYPTAKCVYDLVGNIESLLEALL